MEKSGVQKIDYKASAQLTATFNTFATLHKVVMSHAQIDSKDLRFMWHRKEPRERLVEIAKVIQGEIQARLNRTYPLNIGTYMYEGPKLRQGDNRSPTDLDACEFTIDQCTIYFNSASSRAVNRAILAKMPPQEICHAIRDQTLDAIISDME